MSIQILGKNPTERQEQRTQIIVDALVNPLGGDSAQELLENLTDKLIETNAKLDIANGYLATIASKP